MPTPTPTTLRQIASELSINVCVTDELLLMLVNSAIGEFEKATGRTVEGISNEDAYMLVHKKALLLLIDTQQLQNSNGLASLQEGDVQYDFGGGVAETVKNSLNVEWEKGVGRYKRVIFG